MPDRGRIRAAFLVVGLFVAITPALAGAASALTPPPPFRTTIAASPTTLPVGQTSHVTVTSNRAVTGSYRIQVYDTTYNPDAELKTCSTATTCTVPVTQSTHTTHTYRGRITDNGIPVAGSVSNVSYVTWANSGWTISLSTNTHATTGPAQLTATANKSVTTSPYYIEIFDENGTRVASCRSGLSCPATVNPSPSTSKYVAFVSNDSSTLLPGTIQASSNVVFVTHIIP
jgi:hypothetical protein